MRKKGNNVSDWRPDKQYGSSEVIDFGGESTTVYNCCFTKKA